MSEVGFVEPGTSSILVCVFFRRKRTSESSKTRATLVRSNAQTIVPKLNKPKLKLGTAMRSDGSAEDAAMASEGGAEGAGAAPAMRAVRLGGIQEAYPSRAPPQAQAAEGAEAAPAAAAAQAPAAPIVVREATVIQTPLALPAVLSLSLRGRHVLHVSSRSAHAHAMRHHIFLPSASLMLTARFNPLFSAVDAEPVEAVPRPVEAQDGGGGGEARPRGVRRAWAWEKLCFGIGKAIVGEWRTREGGTWLRAGGDFSGVCMLSPAR